MIEATRKRILDALEYISPEDYNDWITIGMALNDGERRGADIGYEDWVAWASQSLKFNENVNDYKWDSFKNDGITLGTLYHLARENGWVPTKAVYGWDDVIEIDDRPSGPKERPKDTLKFIKALFREGETIAYHLESRNTDEGPKFTFTDPRLRFDQIVESLENGNSIDETFVTYNKEIGGLIRPNPFVGDSNSEKNVLEYRNTVVESDEISIKKQLEIIKKVNLPCRALVHSGNKSIHAVVRVDAKDKQEYKDRVQFIHDVLNEHGFKCDKSMRPANHATRLPGLIRGHMEQKLLGINLGCDSFLEWQNYLNELDNDLPEIEFFDETLKRGLEPLAEEAIEGILRNGHKLYITGPSKAGKSMLLIELFWALATGSEWLGFRCRKSKVLYLNLEVDKPSFDARVGEIGEKLELTASNQNMGILHLRGRAESLDKLAPKLITTAKNWGFEAIIIDPIYKVQSGDENSAKDIAEFTNQIDKISEDLGCSMIYAHHHPKGDMNARRAIDRGSGSGVFGRDADASMDILELECESDGYKSAWRAEFTLREFPPIEPVNFYFDYPCHYLDEDGLLDDAKYKTGSGIHKKSKKKPTADEKLVKWYEYYQELNSDLPENERCSIENMAASLEIKVDSVKRRIRRYNETHDDQFDSISNPGYIVYKP